MNKKQNRKLQLADRIADAEKQISDYAKTVKFTVTEYSFEFIVDRLNSGRYYVPDYQRNLIWAASQKSKFIESVFMDLPIPFVFFWQDQDGKMEIVDGSQRLRTIRDFMDDKFILKDLEIIPALNGLQFSDLPRSRQFKFSETPIRVIILDNSTDAITRTEMFARINTGGTNANDAEIRRGSLPGAFLDLITELANDDTFVELTPISTDQVNKREREELVTRFFSYLHRYDPVGRDGDADIKGYREEPRRFFFQFVKDMNDRIANEQSNNAQSDTLFQMRKEFSDVLTFIKTSSPNGFTKSPTGKQVPRVRFESIAVGSALALRADPTILDRISDITPLLTSKEFSNATKSDAANVKSKLINRLKLTRNWLLEQ